MFVAIVNVPGYLPMAEDLPTFESAAEAWSYLAEERQRDDAAWVPDFPEDPEGPASLDATCLELERRSTEQYPHVGTVYGPTPGMDADDARYDLGLAYSVDYAEESE